MVEAKIKLLSSEYTDSCKISDTILLSLLSTST